MYNFTASFLSYVNKEILDESENPIFSVHYSKEVLPFVYQPPMIRFNIFEENALKKPVIDKINVKTLASLGFCLVTIPIDKSKRWDSKVKKQVKLMDLRNPYVSSYKILKGDADLEILFDEANNRLKIKGLAINKFGETEWVNINERL